MNKQFWIPGNVPSSKNSRSFNIAMRRSFVSKTAAKYMRDTKPYWLEYAEEFVNSLPERRPVSVGFHFVRKTRHRYDFINPLQTVQDLMVKYGWLEDDNMDILVPHPLKIDGTFTTLDPKNPGVYIQIFKFF